MKSYSLLTFITPIIILLFSIVWVGYSIVAKNILSKDIVFSFTALSAAFVMFGLNIAFSLKEEQSQYVVRPHIIITDENIIDVLSYQITKPNFLVFNNEELSKVINIDKLKESLYTTISDRELEYKDQLTSLRFALSDKFYPHTLIGRNRNKNLNIVSQPVLTTLKMELGVIPISL